MTSEERRRPGGEHQGGDGEDWESAADFSSPGRDELLFEVYRLTFPALHAARQGYGHVPAPGSLRWWQAPDTVRVAGLLALAGNALIASPDEIAAEQLKAAAVAISEGQDWSKIARQHVTYTELQRRRAEPGPMRPPCNPSATARWVDTTGGGEAGAA